MVQFRLIVASAGGLAGMAKYGGGLDLGLGVLSVSDARLLTTPDVLLLNSDRTVAVVVYEVSGAQSAWLKVLSNSAC